MRGEVVRDPSTIATAIRIGNPASWQHALAARDESGGAIDEVTDREILRAYRLLAAQEGVFVEPASAASVAGLLKAAEQGQGRPRPAHRVHRHRQRPEGPRLGRGRCPAAGHRPGRRGHRRRAPRPRLSAPQPGFP
ncbi:pyridoxal-phosphate dependent enzyme [Streptomyces tricolor]|nr:pyridoxal-phosphate dependent enzyme [Streptomyces tricolor]